MTSNTALTDEQQAKALELREQRLPTSKIATTLGVSQATLDKFFQSEIKEGRLERLKSPIAVKDKWTVLTNHFIYGFKPTTIAKWRDDLSQTSIHRILREPLQSVDATTEEEIRTFWVDSNHNVEALAERFGGPNGLNLRTLFFIVNSYLGDLFHAWR